MVDIITAIPDLIEHIHSCVEFAQAYSKIDKIFGSDLEHVKRVSQQIKLFWNVLENNNHLRTGRGIHESLLTVESALEDMNLKLDTWKRALNYTESGQQPSAIDSDISTSRKVSLVDSEGKSLSGVNEGDMVGDGLCNFDCGPFGFGWFRARFSFSWIRRRKRAYRMDKSRRKEITDTKKPQSNVIVETFQRVRFVATGAPDLKEALSRMDRALEDLMRFFNLATLLSRTVFNASAQDFIDKALQRRFSELDVKRLSISPSSLEPLDIAYDKEAKYSQSLLYVTEGDFEGFLVDRRFVRHQVDRGGGQKVLEETELVARLLAEDPQDLSGTTGPNIGILRCCGIALPDVDGELHDIIFRLPRAHQKPQTLRRALVAGPLPTIASRVELALRLVTALNVIHRLDIIHKRIRPESIVLLKPEDTAILQNESLGNPYLAGFCYSRMSLTYSDMKPLAGYHVPENIYYHPQHIGSSRFQAYQKSDDVYSLGVCLLEIGLWKSMARWVEEKKEYVLDEYWKLGPLDYVGPDRRPPSNIWDKRRTDLIAKAKNELPFVLGPIYTDVVVTCLEFPEREREAMGPLKNAKRVDFINDVVARLYEINV